MRNFLIWGLALLACSFSADAQSIADALFANQSPKCDYMGQLHDNGKDRNGCGIKREKNGALYIGDVWRGKPSGMGLKISGQKDIISNCPGATFYAGDWLNNKKVGRGRCYAANGDLIYDGNFADDKPTGTYPSRELDMSRYISDITLPNGEYYFGELKSGNPDGYGFYISDKFGIAVVNTKQGRRKGPGIILSGPDNWASVNWTSNDGYEIITDSRAHQIRNDQLNRNFAEMKAGFTEALEVTLEGVTTAVTGVAEIKASNGYSGGAYTVNPEYNTPSAKSSSGSKNRKTSSGTTKADCGTAWMSDSRVYADYDTQLAPNGSRSADISERKYIQQKMKAIRKKWEARGCPITKSPREDN